MKNKLSWLYNEFTQVGKDYADQKEVDVYEKTHSQFRDLQKEASDLIRLIRLNKDDVLADFGCGTGVFAVEASKVCKKVYAVDVSENMLKSAKEKAERAGAKNIEFHHSGFLNFDIKDSTLDIVTSTFSFHHLPDFWKFLALERIYKMMKGSGGLYIKDVILQQDNAITNIEAMIESQEELGGDFLREDAEQHFREEYSTYDWVMDGLLERAGFKILERHFDKGVIGMYLCVKI